ncbi:uncharacterized protein ARMOST_06095 [Armillaria ostoyae]|uniref:Uncharacterized protein n=1 Tax=Armillaria ostoyae TaxID=47428 RepID=A0A284R215_ARMOS|nr:uncharacterized protein ARMOST_06095 [Armillaria ostoyae]
MCSNPQQRREDAANGSCHALDTSLCPSLLHQAVLLLCCPEFAILLLAIAVVASVFALTMKNTFKQFFLASLGRTLDEDMCDIDDSKVDPLHSLYMICGEIGAEEMMERFGRLVWVRQLDRQARLFMFGERLCDYNIPFVNEQDTGTHDIVIDT